MGDDLVITTIDAYDKNASKYSELRPLVTPVLKKLDQFLENVMKTGMPKVLDVGCGPGRDAEYLNSKGVKVVGIDMSVELLKYAREKTPGVDFRQMDMRKLDFSDGEFGGLWVNTSFLHIPKKDSLTTTNEFNRVLSHGGVLFLGIQGHKNDIGNVTDKISDSELMIANPDFKGASRLFVTYEESEIKNLLVESGFSVLEFESRKETESNIVWLNILAKKI